MSDTPYRRGFLARLGAGIVGVSATTFAAEQLAPQVIHATDLNPDKWLLLCCDIHRGLSKRLADLTRPGLETDPETVMTCWRGIGAAREFAEELTPQTEAGRVALAALRAREGVA